MQEHRLATTVKKGQQWTSHILLDQGTWTTLVGTTDIWHLARGSTMSNAPPKSNQIKSPRQILQGYVNTGVDTKTILDRIQGIEYPPQAEHDGWNMTVTGEARKIRETSRGR